jgi:hypothetical protein
MSAIACFTCIKVACASLLVVIFLPLWAFLAVPMILCAIVTTPLAVAVLYSRVWIVYVDYFLTLFYRAVIRSNLDREEAQQRQYAPGEISWRYNRRNLDQYRHPGDISHHTSPSPARSPPTMFTPNLGRSRKSSATDLRGEFANTEGAGNGRNIPSAPPRNRLDEDIDSLEVWENIAAAAAQRRSHRRHIAARPVRRPSIHFPPLDHDVGILPSLAAHHGELGPHRRRRSSGPRYEDMLRLQAALEEQERMENRAAEL